MTAPAPHTHVLACVQFDANGTCMQTAWVPHNALGVPLPTLEQGAAVGGTILAAASVLLAMRLLNPPKETEQ